MRYGIPDSEMKHINLEKLFEVASWGFKRWLAGDRILVRCQAGLNRSGLITCLILMLKGYSQIEAIELIRNKRSEVALFNRNYISWLNMDAQEKLNTFLSSNTADMLKPTMKNLG
jgi:protein-tyrosine phosphatase